MKFNFIKEQMLEHLQKVIGIVERRQTKPVLSNLLLQASDHKLQLTSSDLEIELTANTDIDVESNSDITIPARKFNDICRALPDEANVSFAYEKDRVLLRSGRSRFLLATLPAEDYPVLGDLEFSTQLTVPRQQLRELIEQTGFAMAQQDVRYYLNGLLLEYSAETLRAVTADGHRLAFAEAPLPSNSADSIAKQIIVPRKGILELQRLLADGAEAVELAFNDKHIQVKLPTLCFTSKLIDGRFPDYHRVIPNDGDKTLLVDRQGLREALARTAVLSNEKFRGVLFSIADNVLTISTQNPDKEQAEEELEVEFHGDSVEIAFNINYLLDALAAIETDKIQINLKDDNSSSLITPPGVTNRKYVIMPLRL